MLGTSGGSGGNPNANHLHLEIRDSAVPPFSSRRFSASCVSLPGVAFRDFFLVVMFLSVPCARAQDKPYFVTYDHHLEEPGSLEIEFNPVFGSPGGPANFLASTTEFEYGVKAWWTTEFYLDTQWTSGDSAIFTGYRWENRFRPLMREHWINPVLYVEFENISAADKATLEVVGFDSKADFSAPNAVLRRNKQREIETKLILSSQVRGWNISENLIAEKKLSGDPWEFGYAVGFNRPLALEASARPCRWCRENFVAGMEFYGGLGQANLLTLQGTAHYAAPVVAWNLPWGTTLRVSPGWGLTSTSQRFLLRFGVSYEISNFGRRVRSLFR
jgi:hypothetical protein